LILQGIHRFYVFSWLHVMWRVGCTYCWPDHVLSLLPCLVSVATIAHTAVRQRYSIATIFVSLSNHGWFSLHYDEHILFFVDHRAAPHTYWYVAISFSGNLGIGSGFKLSALLTPSLALFTLLVDVSMQDHHSCLRSVFFAGLIVIGSWIVSHSDCYDAVARLYCCILIANQTILFLLWSIVLPAWP
jgi:hypothetical protein